MWKTNNWKSIFKYCKCTYDDDKNLLTVKPLEIGTTNITLKYKNATNSSFKVTVTDLFDISKFEIEIGYIKGFENKKQNSDLNSNDKEILIFNLFKLNGYKKYLNNLILDNYQSVQGQPINRNFNLTASSYSKVVKGKLDNIFFIASSLDLSDKENRLVYTYSFYEMQSKDDLSNKEKVAKVILETFVTINKALNPIKINDIVLKKAQQLTQIILECIK
ncbi:hypothetical protein SLITO_v1c05840 [Spiroplasma litorale]|uniref:Uncharacterized protein n=1 Tax=Spiroplasma litorale TaxID=216942 RepID=A0A0K1W215_9MOLU|nr:hypothetical protein [Spiroplasma litorale]AKX34218.1 hypothetical protein SLITO_v1c05840 [Spiroplasma litorale]